MGRRGRRIDCAEGAALAGAAPGGIWDTARERMARQTSPPPPHPANSTHAAFAIATPSPWRGLIPARNRSDGAHGHVRGGLATLWGAVYGREGEREGGRVIGLHCGIAFILA